MATSRIPRRSLIARAADSQGSRVDSSQGEVAVLQDELGHATPVGGVQLGDDEDALGDRSGGASLDPWAGDPSQEVTDLRHNRGWHHQLLPVEVGGSEEVDACPVMVVPRQCGGNEGTSVDDDHSVGRPKPCAGPEEVERAVRGRKTLGRHRPAGRSPKRQATLPEELDRRGLAFIEAGVAHDYSALMRTALAEYLDHHANAKEPR